MARDVQQSIDGVPNEILEGILLRVLHADPRTFWRARGVSHLWRQLVEEMANRSDEVVRLLCRGGIHGEAFLEAARASPWDQLDLRRLWARWRALNEIRPEGKMTISRVEGNVRVLKRNGDFVIAALGNRNTLWLRQESPVGPMRKAVLFQGEAFPADRIECLRMSVGGPIQVRGGKIDYDCIVVVEGNKILAYRMRMDTVRPLGFSLAVSEVCTLPSGQAKDVRLSSHRNYILVSMQQMFVAWKISSEASAQVYTRYLYYPERLVACLWPIAPGPYVFDVKLMDLSIWPPLPTNVAKSAFVFRDKLFVVLTADHKMMVTVNVGGGSLQRVSYNTMLALQSYVTSVHLEMNFIFLGTSSGRVYAYKLSNWQKFVGWDLTAWDWVAKASSAGSIVGMELVPAANDSVLLMFASSDRIYTKCFTSLNE